MPQEHVLPDHPSEPDKELAAEIQWLYRNGAIYDDILDYYSDRIDNATLAHMLDGVHLVDQFVLRRSVRTLLALRDSGQLRSP